MASQTAQSRLRRIERKIADAKAHYQAAAVAYEILATATTHGELDSQIPALRTRFLELLENRGFGNLLERHIKYAIKLASSEEELLYEEMHKLFSLCDEIEALRFLGLKVSPALEKELVKALRLRFKREKRKAHLVAEDRFERWKTGWWYTENLARS
jgi:hypothetical protein